MIKVAGAGPGNPDLLTLEVKKLIENTENVIAFGRIKDSLRFLRSDIRRVERVDELVGMIKYIQGDILVLASGDPNFFGIVNLLKRKGIEIVEIFPGISSIQYFCSRLQIPYSNLETHSLHGREFDFSILDLDKAYGFLIDDRNNGNYISKSLKVLGYEGRIYFGYNLSYRDELIIEADIGDLIEEPSSLGVVLVVPYVD